jgi:hypothetical protein
MLPVMSRRQEMMLPLTFKGKQRGILMKSPVLKAALPERRL